MRGVRQAAAVEDRILEHSVEALTDAAQRFRNTELQIFARANRR